MPGHTDVVISSTREDLRPHRAQARDAIEQWGGFPHMMENLPPSPDDAITASLKLVDEAEIYVGVFAHRYGYIPDSPRNPERISITEMEYRHAIERGIPVLIFIIADDHPVTAAMLESGDGAGERLEKLNRFKAELKTQHVVAFFKSAEDLRGYVRHGLESLKPSHHVGGWRPSPVPPANVLPDRGELPPGSRVIMPLNPHFVGREDNMRALAGLLHLNANGSAGTASAAPAAAAITPAAAALGSGGIGKTQMAAEFAYRYGRCFYGVHWLNMEGIAASDDTGRADAEIAACGQKMADALTLPGFPDAQPAQVALTLAAWRTSPPRLVILDNAEQPAAVRAVMQRLPAGCCVLVTSRWDRAGTWDDIGVKPAALDVLSRDQSRDLLRSIASGLSTVPDADLDTLAAKLGCYPLALDLAAHYLRDTGLSVADYLAALDNVGNLLDHRSLRTWAADANNANPTRHDTDVARTFALSWERVTGESESPSGIRKLFQKVVPKKKRAITARDLFMMCGFLAPNTPIPADLLLRLMKDDADALALARGQLSGAGLLRAEPVQIHPLLAAFARAQDGAADHLPTLVNALIRLSTIAGKTGLPATFAPLRAHMEAAATHADAAGVDRAAALWNNLGYYLQDVADYPAARRHYERVLTLYERTLGEDHPNVATAANNLGSLLYSTGDLPAARAYYERALAIDERVYGPDHPNVARDANNLGSLLQDLGDLPAARVYLERALAIDERVYGPDHPNVAIRANNLGGLLQDLGDLPAARAHYERALAIWERQLGENHPNVAAAANNLGLLLQDLGDLPAARAYLERALAIDERVYGLDHPEVATEANNLGTLCFAEGDQAGARAYLLRALRIFEATLPPNHPNIQIVREGLAYLDALEATPGNVPTGDAESPGSE